MVDSRPYLLIDNEDSFTYNLRQSLQWADKNIKIEVERVEYIDKVNAENYAGFIISPGPGIPEEYHFYYPFLDQLGTDQKVLGVCLGMQIMALWKGYRIYRKDEIIHGLEKRIRLEKASKFIDPKHDNSKVGLYHSWAVDHRSGDFFTPVAWDEDGHLMALESDKMLGLQFHPESFLTEWGVEIIQKWISQ